MFDGTRMGQPARGGALCAGWPVLLGAIAGRAIAAGPARRSHLVGMVRAMLTTQRRVPPGWFQYAIERTTGEWTDDLLFGLLARDWRA